MTARRFCCSKTFPRLKQFGDIRRIVISFDFALFCSCNPCVASNLHLYLFFGTFFTTCTSKFLLSPILRHGHKALSAGCVEASEALIKFNSAIVFCLRIRHLFRRAFFSSCVVNRSLKIWIKSPLETVCANFPLSLSYCFVLYYCPLAVVSCILYILNCHWLLSCTPVNKISALYQPPFLAAANDSVRCNPCARARSSNLSTFAGWPCEPARNLCCPACVRVST